jgi:hypothetical protein
VSPPTEPPKSAVELPGSPAAADATPRWQVWLERLFPWGSLLVSAAGAAAMDHSESRGALIAIAAAVSWVAFVIVALLHRPRPREHPPSGRWRRYLRFVSTFANQSLIHYSLLFSAPFYLEACAFTPLQCVFAVLFALAVAVASWDPWCASVLVRPLWGSLLLAFASFCGWNVALPMLGMPHRSSLWLSSLVVGLGIPLVNFASGVSGTRRSWSIAIGLGLPVLLLLGGVAAIPPAPLRVVQARLGTGISEREPTGVQSEFPVAPRELVCWTAIRAPRGLKDALLHVWSRDGTQLRAVAVEVRGGRRAGFRTWSRQRVLAAEPGRYRCDVITTLGQSLGGVSADVGLR